MKLKSFTKISTAVSTRFAVYNGEQFVEEFTVNYLDEQSKLRENLLKRFSYEDKGANVKHVDVYKGTLEVTVQLKGAK